MKIVIDAMCAEYGGIRTYVEHLLGHWSSVHPEDELHVVTPVGSTLDTAAHTRHELRVRRPGTIGRPLAQSFGMQRLIRQLRPDAVLATMPNTTLRRLEHPLAVVVHDLRHELRPEQFSASRRLLRRVSYGRSYKLADGIIAVSGRSLEDLHRLHPYTKQKPGIVAYHGADHVLGWSEGKRTGPAIAFAHHSNKNPDLLLDGWAVLAQRAEPVPPLMIVGLSSENRDRLAADIQSRSLGEHISLSPFLPDDQFQQVMAEADLIVFPSDFEGFGLPVVEGMTLGKPVVIGPEKATTEVAGGHAFVMTDWTAESLAEAVTAARSMSDEDVEKARIWGRTFTWDTTVRETRALLAGLAVVEL